MSSASMAAWLLVKAPPESATLLPVSAARQTLSVRLEFVRLISPPLMFTEARLLASIVLAMLLYPEQSVVMLPPEMFSSPATTLIAVCPPLDTMVPLPMLRRPLVTCMSSLLRAAPVRVMPSGMLMVRSLL